MERDDMPEKKIAIVTDSACDLPDSILQKYDIRFISLRMVCRGGEYRDRREITDEEIYAMLDTELPKTSLPLFEDMEATYDALADEGYTDVIHLCISSGLSGTFNAVAMFATEYTRLNVHVFDTKTLSMQQGIIVLLCARMLKHSQDIDEILAYAQKLRDNSAGYFIVRTLEYLRKGGRIGLVEGVLGTVLQLKPIIWVNDDGIYETVAKVRGHGHAVDTLIKECQKRFEKAKVMLAVVHGSAQADAEKLLDRLKGVLNIEESFLGTVSPVLGIHTGPGLLAVIACRV